MAFTFFLAMSVEAVANWPIFGQFLANFCTIFGYFWPIFGPELETSQLLLHTIAMKAMRIGTAFTFFLAMSIKTVGHWAILAYLEAYFWP